MPEAFLRTKLFIPPLRPNLVARPRLIERLDQGLGPGHKLTLISAPAGFGKTTLVSGWVSGLQPAAASIAWLSLDEADSDPARFLAYLVHALHRAVGDQTGIGTEILALLRSRQQPPLNHLLANLINDLAALQQTLVIVLDDYHVVEPPAVDNALIFLLENLPPLAHLLVATRDDPGLPLGRLRALGQLTELRAADLRFTSAEAAEFLTQSVDLHLAAEEVAALDTRTEGWIAGLQLAAASLQNHKNAAKAVQSFTGSHRFVLDYLVEEVLLQQPEELQRFLLQTAILDRLTGPLCDALTGRDDGQATLEMLERANLFIIPLDDERRWYRYHHLFADLLHQRQQFAGPGEISQLHRRASAWCCQNGFVDQAVRHAFQAEDEALAADLLDTHLDTLRISVERGKLQEWLDRLPEERLTTSPHLGILQANLLCGSGQPEAAERALAAVERALECDAHPASEAERRTLLGRAAATRALIYSYLGDVAGIIRSATRAQAHLPEDDFGWRSAISLTLGNACGFRGDMPAAYEARLKALQACQATGDAYFIILANLELAITLRELGRLQQVLEICRQQQALALENGFSQSRVMGWLLAVWGETLAERNELSEALEKAGQGFKLAERGQDLQMLGWSFMCLVRVLISAGELTAAEATIGKLEALARVSSLPPWIDRQVAAWRARLRLAQGLPEAAADWLAQSGLYGNGQPILDGDIDFFLLLDYLVLARILLARGRADEAATLLGQLLPVAEASGRIACLIEILALRALALQAAGRPEHALFTLARALNLAEPAGFARVFLDQGPPMAELLREALRRGVEPSYVCHLLAALPVCQAPPPALDLVEDGPPTILEPLSDREVEVLRLVALGLSNREIAARLYLSTNTVKVHTRNINGKLDTHNRTQAVAVARALGILPEG